MNLYDTKSENLLAPFQMAVIFPDYVSSEDKLWKGYITECLYRMCSFSGSSASVRSFVEYSTESENSTNR